jgi:hypothetical protein
MTSRLVGIVGRSPRYLNRAGALCIAAGCLGVALADALWPAGLLAVAAAGAGGWLFERSRTRASDRERMAQIAAEYETEQA